MSEEETFELTFHLISEKITNKCAYPKCKKMVKVLLRDGRSNYFLPLCDFHRFKYDMFDDPRKEQAYKRWKKKEEKENANKKSLQKN